MEILVEALSASPSGIESFRAFVQMRCSRGGVGFARCTLSGKRITITIDRSVGCKQLMGVTDDCSFQAACAYEAQQPADEKRESVLKPCHESDVYDEPDEPRDSAGEPDPCALRTALRRSTAAMLPRSRYFQGVAAAPSLMRFLIVCAACRPD
jgi:hypothetical protein